MSWDSLIETTHSAYHHYKMDGASPGSATGEVDAGSEAIDLDNTAVTTYQVAGGVASESPDFGYDLDGANNIIDGGTSSQWLRMQVTAFTIGIVCNPDSAASRQVLVFKRNSGNGNGIRWFFSESGGGDHVQIDGSGASFTVNNGLYAPTTGEQHFTIRYDDTRSGSDTTEPNAKLAFYVDGVFIEGNNSKSGIWAEDGSSSNGGIGGQSNNFNFNGIVGDMYFMRGTALTDAEIAALEACRNVSNQDPDDPTALAQFEGDETTSVPQSGTFQGNSAAFEASMSDPDGGQQVQLEVEVKPFSGSFDGIGTVIGPLEAQGTSSKVLVEELAVDQYKWRCRTKDDAGANSNWVEFGTAAVDFEIINSNPLDPTTLQQFEDDGSTAISAGGSVPNQDIVLKTFVQDNDFEHNLTMEVEIVNVGQSFTGTATHSQGGVNNSETTVDLTVPSSFFTPGNYKWRTRTTDNFGGASNWVEFQVGDVTDFTIQDSNPDDPTVLGQFEDDGTTVISQSGIVSRQDIVLKATVSDALDNQDCQVEVEVKDFASAFDGVGTVLGNVVTSGSVSSATVSGLTIDQYKWRARTVDAGANVSLWVEFGTAAVDFDIQNIDPQVPASLGQFEDDGTTPIVQSGSVPPQDIVLKATITDGASEVTPDNCQAEFEVKPFASPFDGTGTDTTTLSASGSVHSVTITSTPEGDYKWRVRSIDALGAMSAWVEFGTAAVDFNIANTAPTVPTSLGQFRANGTTALAQSEAVQQQNVVLKAVVNDVDVPAQDLQLEVEVKDFATAFDGVGTQLSGIFTNGQLADVNVGGLAVDQYKWRCRTVDELAATSAWVEFGTAAVDFELIPVVQESDEQGKYNFAATSILRRAGRGRTPSQGLFSRRE